MKTPHSHAGLVLGAFLLLACSSKSSPKLPDAATDALSPASDAVPADLPASKDGVLADSSLPADGLQADVVVGKDVLPDEPGKDVMTGGADGVTDLLAGKDVNADLPLPNDARDVPLGDVPTRDSASDLGPVCSPTSRLSCNDDPNASAVWGTCQPDGSCLCNDGFVLNSATGRCTVPGRDASRDTDTQPGVCTGDYDACTCKCCDGDPVALMCYYPSLGESIAAIAAEVEAKTLATDCTLAGCTRAIHYVCCPPASPEPSTSATYTADGHVASIDRLGITKTGADCAQLSFIDGSGTSGFRIEADGRWSAVSGSFGSCADGGVMERARGALGTLTFRTSGDQCVLDLHATLFAISATGEVKTARMDAEGVPAPSGMPNFCR
jgi:hypothetical protein